MFNNFRFPKILLSKMIMEFIGFSKVMVSQTLKAIDLGNHGHVGNAKITRMMRVRVSQSEIDKLLMRNEAE